VWFIEELKIHSLGAIRGFMGAVEGGMGFNIRGSKIHKCRVQGVSVELCFNGKYGV